MTDRDLTDLLERLGDRVDVSPPPLAAMARAADRTRRRRTAWVVGSAAAAVAVVAAGTQVVGDGMTDGRDPTPSSPVARPVPDGTRLVGLGHAAIAVPEDWGQIGLDCHAPMTDGVVIDVAIVLDCGTRPPPGVDAVLVRSGRAHNLFATEGEFVPDRAYEIDGVLAQRSRVTCVEGTRADWCAAGVYLPSVQVYFEVSSTTSRDAVEDLLDEVRVLADDQVGVPAFGGATDGLYVNQLSELGLTMVKKWGSERGSGGRVLDVQPAPGTVVSPGTEITVSVTRPPTDDMVLGLAAYRPDGSPTGSLLTELTDVQIRSGATVQLKVGDRISFHARGESTYGADVAGTSLDIEHLPADDPYPRRATAVRPGTTTFTLTSTSDGEEVQVGSITVVVR